MIPKKTGKNNSSIDKTKSNAKIKVVLSLLDINNDIDENKTRVKNEKK